ncbi:cyclic nucleotide-binding domain-containing protein [Roseiconus nitratireducens]|uniref:Cyclic nucleotide-binding domain-containing protein n=1 Tax=Roseiconus nitratireducens TaxID=2605748 RepID=A0A5M6D341_9BACT|nr:protein phosphatase 2C domain-containing protein [Roseiconus nitratireducens]KAA5541753.1 cyclic nucleotide-binding domain-containing protein [Roseiconus nitratireducens]
MLPSAAQSVRSEESRIVKTAASALSDRGLRRDGNEDHYLIDETLGLYVVCDGMGGHAAGEIAAGRAIEFAAQYIARHLPMMRSAKETPNGYYRVLKIAEQAVQTASHELYHLARSSPEFRGMGTTMTMLIVVDDKAVMAHVGDSRLYLLRDSDLHQLSTDHTLANEMYLAGGLTLEQAARSRFQHVLTRSIGPQEFVAVETLLFDLLPGDRFLICSDGLSNYFDEQKTVKRILAERDILDQLHRFIDFAKEAGGADNITAVVVEARSDCDSRPSIDTQQRIARLQSTFLCKRLSVRRLMHLLSIASTIQCAAGKELIAPGQEFAGFWVVLRGRISTDDDEVCGQEFRPGDCFGETALVEPAMSRACFKAAVPSQLLFIERARFNTLTRKLPRLGNVLLRNLSRHLSKRLAEAESVDAFNLDDTGPLL